MSLEHHPIRVLIGNAPFGLIPQQVRPNGHANSNGHAQPQAANPSQGNPNPRRPQPVAQPVTQTPPIDIHEEPEGLVLEADLPGVSEDLVTVQIEENVLTLHARNKSRLPEGVRALHEEFAVADFHRSFILSDEVDRDRISAELKNGVLRLVLPKAERVKTRRIEIKSS